MACGATRAGRVAMGSGTLRGQPTRCPVLTTPSDGRATGCPVLRRGMALPGDSEAARDIRAAVQRDEGEAGAATEGEAVRLQRDADLREVRPVCQAGREAARHVHDHPPVQLARAPQRRGHGHPHPTLPRHHGRVQEETLRPPGSGASNARYMSMPPLCGVRY
eukprot:3409708-Rhodomonas_salina.3